MTADTIGSFLYRVGFLHDSYGQAKVEESVKALEARLTAANAAELNKRIAQENKATAERIATAIKAGKDLTKEDKAFIVAQERERVDAADREKKRQAEAGKRRDDDNKKAQAARDENFKRTEQQFLRLASAAVKFTAALDVAKVLDQLTFGSFSKLSGAASDLERMKYVGDSAGTSIKGLQAFGFAASQLGQSADAAQSDLKRFGDQLATFPGYEEQIRSFGVATRDMNGHLRDAADIAKDLGPVFEKMPRATREAYASAHQFSEGTLQAMIRPGFGGFYGHELANQARVGADANLAGERAADFERSMRQLNDAIHAVKVKVETELFPLIKPALDQISAWVLDHGKAISDVVNKITKGIADVAAAFVKSGLVKDALNGVSDGLERFAGYVNSDGFRKDMKSFVADVKAVAGALRWALEKLGILPSSGATVPEPQVGSADPGGGQPADIWYRGMHGRHPGDLSSEQVGKASAAFGRFHSGGGPAALSTQQQRDNAAAVADELRKAGAPNEGIAAVLGSVQTESTFNPRAHNDVTGGHTGIWQWDSRRWPKVEAWIKSQGGDPWDIRWQTRAYVAEGRAKPGDPLYDNDETSSGFRDVMDSKGNLPKAVHGVQRSERYGRGEEGGRAAHAGKWLDHLPGSPSPPPVAATDTPGTAPAKTDGTASQAALSVADARQAVGAAALAGAPEAADRIKAGKARPGDKEKVQKWMDALAALDKAEKAGGVRRDTHEASRAPSGPEPIPGPEVRGAARLGHFEPKNDSLPTPAQMRGATYDTKGPNGEVYHTADMRDPRFAPKPAGQPGQIPGSAAVLGQGFSSSGAPVKVDVVKAVPLSEASKEVAKHLADAKEHLANTRLVQAAGHGMLHPFLHGAALSHAEMVRRAAHNSIRHGNVANVTHSPTYNVSGTTVEAGLKMAKEQGERGTADLMRNIAPMVT